MSKPPPPPGTVATVASLPPPDVNPDLRRHGPSTSNEDDEDYYACPPFPTDGDYDAYVARVSPRRELVCPITQEVFRDPVVALDGHTYERTSLLRWFQTHQRGTRSPTTNALMPGKTVVPNLAVGGMARAHRERLGEELLRRCEWIRRHGGTCGDRGARVEALLDAGADPALRGGEGGDTALLALVRTGARDVLPVARMLCLHDAPVLTANDAGLACLAAAERAVEEARARGDGTAAMEWTDFAEMVRGRGEREREKAEERERARARTNEEHRETQRSLAAEERRARVGASAEGITGGAVGQRGLGTLEEGWGYFPSLTALQFQGSVPEPSPSVAEAERKERRRLEVIVRTVGALAAFYFICS